MEKYIVIYFLVVLFFLRNIFIDLKLLLFFILSGIIVYFFIKYYGTRYNNDNDNINDNVNDNVFNDNVFNDNNVIYKYGTISENKAYLDTKSIDKLKYIKSDIDNMDIDNRTKIEIYSNLKKFINIYTNYNNYHYKKNWSDDLVNQKTYIYNKIASLNVAYSDKDIYVERLFNIVEEFLDNYLCKLNNSRIYNFNDHPSGYNQNQNQNQNINQTKYDLF